MFSSLIVSRLLAISVPPARALALRTLTFCVPLHVISLLTQQWLSHWDNSEKNDCALTLRSLGFSSGRRPASSCRVKSCEPGNKEMSEIWGRNLWWQEGWSYAAGWKKPLRQHELRHLCLIFWIWNRQLGINRIVNEYAILSKFIKSEMLYLKLLHMFTTTPHHLLDQADSHCKISTCGVFCPSATE